MKVFIEKYEKRALEKGSQEIYSAVMILVEEQDKYEYGLNQEESEVLDRMKSFGAKFCELWGGIELAGSLSNQTHAENKSSIIVAKLHQHEYSEKMKGI